MIQIFILEGPELAARYSGLTGESSNISLPMSVKAVTQISPYTLEMLRRAHSAPSSRPRLSSPRDTRYLSSIRTVDGPRPSTDFNLSDNNF
jgi:hypothetical protein